MEKPQTLKQHEELEYVQGKLRKYDLGFGGIYDKALVRAMDKFTQTRRLQEGPYPLSQVCWPGAWQPI
jgi:hypothetical protein